MSVDIKGLQEAQKWNLRAIANMKPTGEYGRAIRDIITQIQRAEVSRTHVITGALRASIRIEIRGTSAKTFIDPAAVNPRGGRPAKYGPVEDARGGGHAFGKNTVNLDAPRIVGIATQRLGRSLT